MMQQCNLMHYCGSVDPTLLFVMLAGAYCDRMDDSGLAFWTPLSLALFPGPCTIATDDV
jgi:hypothetical protein